MNTDISDLPRLIRAKVKDTRVLWAILSLVVAIVLFAIVARLVVMGSIERTMLEGDLDATRARIAQIEGLQGVNPETLQQQIAQRRAELQGILAGFPTTTQVDQELGRYYQYASELQTQLVRMEAMLNTPEEDAQTAYRVQRFLLGVRGDVPQLLRFLGRLSSVPYKTFIIDNIAIRPNGGGVGESMGNADLVVYSSDLVSGTAPIPEVVAPGPTATVGQTDNISEIEDYMRRAIADQDWAAAIAHGRHILQLDPARQDVARDVYQAHVSWGRALAAAGQTTEARQQYSEALSLVPNGQEAVEGLRALEPLTPSPAAIIPKASPIAALPAPTPAPAVLYTVLPGDTLSSVAARHHVSVQVLMQANNLSGPTIVVGQRLVVPEP